MLAQPGVGALSGHDLAGDLAGDRRTIDFGTLNNLDGLVFVRGHRDYREFAGGRVQTRFEADDQMGQIFVRQLGGWSILPEAGSNGGGMGCAGMRQAWERCGVGRRGAGWSRHSSPRWLKRSASWRVAPQWFSLGRGEEGPGGRMRRRVHADAGPQAPRKGQRCSKRLSPHADCSLIVSD